MPAVRLTLRRLLHLRHRPPSECRHPSRHRGNLDSLNQSPSLRQQDQPLPTDARPRVPLHTRAGAVEGAWGATRCSAGPATSGTTVDVQNCHPRISGDYPDPAKNGPASAVPPLAPRTRTHPLNWSAPLTPSGAAGARYAGHQSNLHLTHRDKPPQKPRRDNPTLAEEQQRDRHATATPGHATSQKPKRLTSSASCS